MDFNDEDVKRTLQILGLNKLELRPLDLRNTKAYPTEINIEDPNVIDFIKSFNGRMNVYVGINKRNYVPAKLPNIESVKTIIIDIDAVRMKGQPCTDTELIPTKEVALNIIKWLKEQYKDCEPSLAMSGNGHQVWVPVKEVLTNGSASDMLDSKIKLFHSIIIDKFRTDKAEIDNIGDLPRIIKLVGTLSIKGDNTPERPHRLSYWVEYHGREKESKNLIQDILKLDPEKFKPKAVVKVNKNESSYEVDAILSHREYDYKLDKLLNGDIEGYQSSSEAELGLACKLVFYGASSNQILDIINNSFIQNWKEKTESYKTRTINKAFELTTGRWIKPHEEFNDDLADKMDVNVSDPQFKVTWANWFDNFVWNSPEMAEAYMLVMVSMLLKKTDCLQIENKKIDPRVHMMVIQPPGSGKSQSVKIAQTILDLLNQDNNTNFKLTIRTKLTSDASIVGTWRMPNSSEKQAIKDGTYVEGYEKGMIWVRGDLQTSDILYLGEASSVLCEDVKNRDLREIQNSLLEAMNEGGLISKKKAETEEKTYYSNANILLFSRPTREMIKNPEILVASGMIRRCIPIFKDKSRAERLEDIEKFHEMLLYGNTTTDFKFVFNQVKNYMEVIYKFTQTNKIQKIETDAVKFSSKFVKNLFNESKNNYYEDFISGSILNYVWVLGACYCAIRCATEEDKEPNIKEIDVMRGCKFINTYMDGTLRFLETQDKKVDLFNKNKKVMLLRRVLGILPETFTQEELIKEMLRQGKFSKRTIEEFLKTHESIGHYLEKFKDENDKRVIMWKRKK